MQLGHQLAVEMKLIDGAIEPSIGPYVAGRSGQPPALFGVFHKCLPEFAVEDAQYALTPTFVACDLQTRRAISIERDDGTEKRDKGDTQQA